MKQLFSFAKTIGKHLWDKNKKKIITKGTNFLQQKIKNKGNIGRIVSGGLDQMNQVLQNNDYSISKASEAARSSLNNMINSNYVGGKNQGGSIFHR